MDKENLQWLLKGLISIYGFLALISFGLFVWAQWLSDIESDHIWQRILLGIFGDQLTGFKPVAFIVVGIFFITLAITNPGRE